MRGRSGLDDAGPSLLAGIFRADGDDHLVAGRDDVETLGLVFTNADHVATSAGAGDIGWLDNAFDARKVFAFTRLDPSQWKSARTTNAIERLNEKFRRRTKTQTVLPCAETVPMLVRALLASGQIQMRKVDGWATLSQPIEPMPLDLAA